MSTIFRNKWLALLWAAGICFAASELADTLSGVTANPPTRHAAPSTTGDDTDPLATPPPKFAAGPPAADIAR